MSNNRLIFLLVFKSFDNCPPVAAPLSAITGDNSEIDMRIGRSEVKICGIGSFWRVISCDFQRCNCALDDLKVK